MHYVSAIWLVEIYFGRIKLLEHSAPVLNWGHVVKPDNLQF